MNSKLFSPIKIRNLEIKNKIFMAPMCQYSAKDGIPSDWHDIHLTSRAAGGVGLIIIEATGVVPNGRITDQCLGIYNELQLEAFKKIVSRVHQFGTKIGIQLAHSGRKGTGNFEIVAPTSIAFNSEYRVPKELSILEIDEITNSFVQAAKNAHKAGFDLVEIHMAHGYLLHQFLSPHSNKRSDEFGGSLVNRMRFPLNVAKKIRDIWPVDLPVFVRISATDWIESNGLTLEEIIEFSKELKKIGIDFLDVSTGGNVSDVKIPVGPNYQVAFANKIKKEVQIPTGAVGLITDALQAEKILQEDAADAILIGRALLRDPYWAINASTKLEGKTFIPIQYLRAF